MLAFHGFGRKAEDFLLFRSALEEKFTIYSLNFFHHGNSVYPAERVDHNTLQPEELKAIVAAFLEKNKIMHFSLMGYSMGGKISLSILEQMPERIEHLFLLAPDGIKINFWYKFTSKNKFGNFIYRRILYHPKPFFALLKFLHKTKCVSDKMYRFVNFNLETEEKRKLVYTVWMTMRHIEPDPKKCAVLVKEYHIDTQLFFGKYDRIIKPKTGKWFAGLIDKPEALHLIECGHMMFMEATTKAISESVDERMK